MALLAVVGDVAEGVEPAVKRARVTARASPALLSDWTVGVVEASCKEGGEYDYRGVIDPSVPLKLSSGGNFRPIYTPLEVIEVGIYNRKISTGVPRRLPDELFSSCIYNYNIAIPVEIKTNTAIGPLCVSLRNG